MIGLLQRVSAAKVEIDGDTFGEIGRGLMVLVGVERDDGPAEADRSISKCRGYLTTIQGGAGFSCAFHNVRRGCDISPVRSTLFTVRLARPS